MKHHIKEKMQKFEMLSLLQEKVCKCEKCPDLVKSRTQTVFGEGNPNSSLVILGESPGTTEDKTGKPFVGRSGKLLDVMLENIGLKREDVFILNVLKCHPEHNRNPTPLEAENCRPFLDLQLKIINPKIIVCLGLVAAKNLLKIDQPLNKFRNSWYNYNTSKVKVSYHPAFLLRNPSAKTESWKDFEEIKRELNL